MNQNVSKSKKADTLFATGTDHVASLEKPLLGAVLCCTAIATEDRARLAEYAEHMGAEHKLDLTSDVTHLLVGSTDTPKYQYVAREREDVKILRPEWIEAVRECWMEDKPLDMNALEADFRVPTLAGLRVCITGFDDLTFRAQLQKNVISNGGEYTGDLTKDVTHLIAARPEGKKYEYATLWQTKVVSLQWYKDTLERGMQLDETKYHPARPADEQGVGAWNRQEKRQPNLGKRVREEQLAQEPTRKLRRVASARLSSQTDNMWGDIVGQPAQPTAESKGDLHEMKSMPAMHPPQQPTKRAIHPDHNEQVDSVKGGFLRNLHFAVTNFEKRQENLVRQTLQAADAVVMESVADLLSLDDVDPSRLYLIVSHQSRQSELPPRAKQSATLSVVTELWLERCMFQKAWLPPSRYPLGGLVTKITSPKIEQFTVNATGFQSIETLHISRTIALTGAKYAEVFTPKSSVLVCNSMNINVQKLFHAKQWGVPAVSENWLCKFLVEGSVPHFDEFLIEKNEEDDVNLEDELKQKRADRNQRRPPDNDGGGNSTKMRSISGQTTSFGSITHAGTRPDDGQQGSKEDTSSRDQSQTQGRSQNQGQKSAAKDITMGAPLQEISPNSPSRRSKPTSSPVKKSLFRSYDGSVSGPESKSSVQPPRDAVHNPSSPTKLVPDTASINSAIEDLLNMKAKAKVNATAQQKESKDKKKRLLGRALSNLSNVSHASRQSRASSIDSLNTDGIGSEIPPPSAKSNNNTQNTTMGAQPAPLQNPQKSNTRSTTNASTITESMYQTAPIDFLQDPFAPPEELTPQMTQLGYEDSEEAIALREKLAAKRRARSKLGQNEGDPEPEIGAKERLKQKEREKEKKVIKDDDTLNATGWGAGRRTRAKNRSIESKGDLDMF